MIFIMHVIIGTVNQRTFLGTLPVSNKKRLKLFGLHVIHHFSYHLGRGTFSATLVRQVQKDGANTPESINFPENS
jgi:cell division protein FtsB